MRIVGIDFGLKRIGLAVSDERRLFARPLELVIAEKTPEATIKKLLEALSSLSPIESFVIGLPLLLNGKDSPMSLQVREFAAKLEELSKLPVVLWDERLTSAQVERTLKEAEFSRKKRVPLIDGMAAAAILQNFLEFRRN